MDLRRLLPFGVRAELARWRRWPGYLADAPGFARRRADRGGRARFGHVLAEHRSPLARRAAVTIDPALQRGKERNVALAAGRIDGLLVGPYEIFSYHWTVGRPSRLRGFRAGLELRGGALARGVGGGACQVSNLLYYLALASGMRIVERHRHGLDLFPDDGRSLPFGCGATVSYQLADLRFQNPLAEPVLVRLAVADGQLRGRLLAATDPGYRVEVYEAGHRFVREADGWVRENHIRRRFRDASGAVMLDQEVAHNRGRVLYEPCGAPR